ncbi:MAG: hypothetical protein ACKOW1_04315 [Novosphingobium sp.]
MRIKPGSRLTNSIGDSLSISKTRIKRVFVRTFCAAIAAILAAVASFAQIGLLYEAAIKGKYGSL